KIQKEKNNIQKQKNKAKHKNKKIRYKDLMPLWYNEVAEWLKEQEVAGEIKHTEGVGMQTQGFRLL
ncbi:hypothetical protein, partial [Klebsiella pneumoniae]|uniref:hypothetical protein n=1 Tax=Klebsiella pneumoniae TaxID=573 RepID=UPI001D0F4529